MTALSITTNMPIIFIVLVLAIAVVTDLRSQRIPNLLTLPAILVAIAFHFIINGGSGLWFSLAGLATGIGVLILPYLLGGMGAGDAKLMGAVGALVGVKGVFISFLLAALAGGLYALVILVVKRRHFNGFIRSKVELCKTFILTRKYIPDATPVQQQNRPRLCYGLAIALGSITYMALDLTGYAFPI